MIKLAQPKTAPNFCFEIVNLDDEKQTVFIQSDWDYPSIASSFGWDIRNTKKTDSRGTAVTCQHDTTDGTVTCKECGLTASDFISAAYDFLVENVGATVNDPGYF
jgi:hypothetical protein